MSVCSGAFMLGAAGLLDGRRCATHWRYADALARRYPLAQVDLDVLYVEDGPVLTSAGTAAGIDACLHLVRADHGAQVAARIARRMVVPRTVRVASASMSRADPRAELDEPAAGARLGRRTSTGRTASLSWLPALKCPSALRQAVRGRGRVQPAPVGHRAGVGLARRLLEGTDADVESIAHACGLSSGALLRQLFQRSVGVSPSTYRRQFSASP